MHFSQSLGPKARLPYNKQSICKRYFCMGRSIAFFRLKQLYSLEIRKSGISEKRRCQEGSSSGRSSTRGTGTYPISIGDVSNWPFGYVSKVVMGLKWYSTTCSSIPSLLKGTWKRTTQPIFQPKSSFAPLSMVRATRPILALCGFGNVYLLLGEEGCGMDLDS